MKREYWALLVFALIIVLQWIGLGFHGQIRFIFLIIILVLRAVLYGTDTASTAMIHLLCESVSLFMLLHMANLSCSCKFRITFMVLCEFRLQLDCFVVNSNCYRNNCFKEKVCFKAKCGNI